MNVPSKSQVLVLSMCLAFAAIFWTSGCAGVADPLPSLAITPNVLTVSAKIGTASSQTVSVTNISTTNVSISQAIVSGTGFSVTGLTTPLSLTPQQSQSFAVKFAAATTGAVNGTLTIMTDARHRPAVLSLHGTAATTSPNVASVAVTPATASPVASGKVQFTAAVQGTTTNDSVTWTTSMGTITSAGVYTAPATAATTTVTATSVADPTKSASAVVTVGSPSTPPGPAVSSVTVSPSPTSSTTGGTLPFTATVQGSTSNTAVTWKAVLGTITSSGAYTAPAKAGTDTVTATSVADTTKSGSAIITVTTAAPTPVVTSIAVSPTSPSASTNGPLSFTATVNGTVSDKSVAWSASLGTITSSGAYTAPAKAGTDTVTATSNADKSKSASTTVAVTVPVSNPSPSASCAGSNCPAFPGAEGGGAASAGGRGGVVFEVTNLNDSGSGSLRACVEASGPRTCVFRVAGYIYLQSRLQAYSPYLTIAGQTSPGGVWFGSQIAECLFVSTHDVVVRYMGFSGDNPAIPSGPDFGSGCFELASASIYNVVIDHTTARWYGNKAYALLSNDAGNVHNVSFQWNLEYEPNANHPVGGLGTDATSGSAMATTEIDFHHNMIANFDHRGPLLQGANRVRWVNNVVFNWNQFAGLTMGGLNVDWIGNKWVDGNLSSYSVHAIIGNGNGNDPNDQTDNCANGACDNAGPPTWYMLNNIGRSGVTPRGSTNTPTTVVNDAGEISMTAQGWEGGGSQVDPNSNGPAPSSWFRNTPLPTEQFPIVADPVTNLDGVLLATVGNSQHLDCNGNWVSSRDSQDARVIAQYQAGGPGQTFSGQYSKSAIPAGTACQESMHDGIPDQWKSRYGLSTSDTGLGARQAPNGYTYLENYLNGTDPTK